MSYSVNAFMPIEGYRVAFNGTQGRLEVRDHERQSWKPEDETEIYLIKNFGQREKISPTGSTRRRPRRRRHAIARPDFPQGRCAGAHAAAEFAGRRDVVPDRHRRPQEHRRKPSDSHRGPGEAHLTSTTMKRIAADLGVSVTTISKVLNHHADIGHATRARVLKRVEELGYRPNAVARSLSLKRTHTVGIIIPDLMHSFFVEIVSGLESVVSQRGYGLLLCSSGEDARKERSEIEMLRARQVDGIVLASANATGNTALLRELTALGIALVMIDRDDHPRVSVTVC